MWGPLVFEGENYLVRYIEETSIKVLLTDFKTIWYEELSKNDMLERFMKSNPLIDADADEIYNQIKNVVINSVDFDTAITLTKDSDALNLELKCLLPQYIIRCSFNFRKGNQEMYFNEFTLPLMQSVQYLEMRQKRLSDLLEKKDKEIQEHQLEGGEISRKSLVTGKFDRAALSENIPERLFLNVFGRSKPFYAVFTKQFGSVSINSKSVKLENSKENVKKKLKVEPDP